MSTLTIRDLHATVDGPRDPARRRPRGALGRGARAHGPERLGQVDARRTCSWAAATTRSPRGSVTHRRRGAARPADLAARRARAVPRDAVPGRGARRARSTTSSARRCAAGAATPTASRERVDAEADAARRRATSSSTAASTIEFSGGEQKRAETLQLAVLAAEVRGPRRDRLRPRRRRAARRRPPRRGDDRRGRPRRARDHALRAAARPSCAPTACTCSWPAASSPSGGPELADELEATRLRGPRRPSSASTSSPSRSPTAEADPFADPGF